MSCFRRTSPLYLGWWVRPAIDIRTEPNGREDPWGDCPRTCAGHAKERGRNETCQLYLSRRFGTWEDLESIRIQCTYKYSQSLIFTRHLATGTVVSACRCTVPLMCAEVSSVNTTRFLLDSLHLGVWAESVLCTLSAQ
jgi:hypothetical protein